MSDDDLLQFAAVKVGGNIYNHSLDGVITPYIHVGKGSKIHYLTLTSWGLFGRGLAAYSEHYCDIVYRKYGKKELILMTNGKEGNAIMSRFTWDRPGEIPLAFWRAWYRLEKESKDE